ncbi:MAG: hypothetical protein U0792_22730 [Gemmataceae bacterium]
MAKSIVFDEIHVTIRIPNELSQNQSNELSRTLTGDDFMNRLRRAIRGVVRAYPELSVVHVALSR